MTLAERIGGAARSLLSVSSDRRFPEETRMVDAKTADQALQTYIRPQTFPVAIRMLRPGEPIPERGAATGAGLRKLSMNCQVIDMARRYGWMIALTREDSICSLGITALGFDTPHASLQLGHALRGHVHGDQGGGRSAPRRPSTSSSPASTTRSWWARSTARRSSPTWSWSTRTPPR